MMRARRRHDHGFTLLEVMVAMLIGTIALMGTLAVQQAIINASKNANDSAVALRLASQKIEELASRPTDTQNMDAAYGLSPVSGGTWSAIENVDAQGTILRTAVTPANRYTYRWQRQWKVTNTGPSLPYVISVVVTYFNDSGDPKSTRLDMERRKTW